MKITGLAVSIEVDLDVAYDDGEVRILKVHGVPVAQQAQVAAYLTACHGKDVRDRAREAEADEAGRLADLQTEREISFAREDRRGATLLEYILGCLLVGIGVVGAIKLAERYVHYKMIAVARAVGPQERSP